MKRARVSTCAGECPVQRALEILDGKWTLLILRELLDGTRRFGELRRATGGVNPKTLSDRLRTLEEHDVLQRQVFAEVPPRVEYTLTVKGRELAPVIAALGDWGRNWTRAEP
jgi:DNA-binding HxlR family transcriptional regulator